MPFLFFFHEVAAQFVYFFLSLKDIQNNYKGQDWKSFSSVSLPPKENTSCEKDNRKLKIAVITLFYYKRSEYNIAPECLTDTVGFTLVETLAKSKTKQVVCINVSLYTVSLYILKI